jgi:hypothetical protein
MKIGIICESTANSYYRALFPMRALQSRGHTVLWPDGIHDIPMGSLASCDLVHCYRRIDRISDLRKLAQFGVAISFDNDDDYATAQVSHGGTGHEGHRFNNQMARLIAAAASTAHVTTTTCAPLAERFRTAGVENVRVIGNHLDTGMAGFGTSIKHDGVVPGWVADREHRVDLERLPIASALETLVQANPDLRVVSVGLRLPIRSDRYEHIESVPFPELLLTTRRFDIGIAPLADIAFNRSRSDVKVKEYSSGGAAWLASPVGPYAGLGESQGGMLVSDGAWVDTAQELIGSARKRRRLAKRASRWAKEQTIDRHADLWESAFAEAIERAASLARRA